MRLKHPFLAALVGLAVLMNLVSFRTGHEWGDDFALYIAQAQSIVHHTIPALQRHQEFLRNESTVKLGPVFYPWGFPLLLAPVCALMGLNFFALKLYVFCFFLLAIAAVYVLFRFRIDRSLLLQLLVAFLLAPVFFTFKENVLSDIPYLFFSLVCIYGIRRFIVERRPWRGWGIDGALLGTMLFLASFVRAQGFVFVAVMFACQLVEWRRSKDVPGLHFLSAQALPYIVALACGLISKAVFPSSSYEGLLESPSLASTLRENIVYYFWLPSDLLYQPAIAKVFPLLRFVPKSLYALSLPAALIGMKKEFRTDYLFILVIVGTIIPLLPLPFQNGVRYIFPALPFYLYFVLVGLARIQQSVVRCFPVHLRWDAAALWLVIAWSSVIDAGIIWKSWTGMRTIEGPFSKSGTEMIGFIRQETASTDTVIFRKPRALWLLTGRESVAINDAGVLRGKGGDYLVIEDESHVYDQPPMQRGVSTVDSTTFHLVFRNERYSVYKIAGDEGKKNSGG